METIKIDYTANYQAINTATYLEGQKDRRFIKMIVADNKPSNFCPEIQFVRFDSLEKKDYPNGIDMNSIYITFEVNHKEKKIKLHSCGHVYLSPSDLKTDKYRYHAMKSIIDVYKDLGGKIFFYFSFKTEKDAAKKMFAYYTAVMESVNLYTNGYPYKKGVL